MIERSDRDYFLLAFQRQFANTEENVVIDAEAALEVVMAVLHILSLRNQFSFPPPC